ncbi:MAG: PRC-barrel domain-containing protein [Desulforhopalus sp.]
MKKLITTFFAFVAMLALVSPLYATGDYGKESDKAGSANITAEEIEGMQVVSQTGEEIGEIQRASIDEQSGKVKFVTISKGGVLGMGGENIAIPFEALQFDQQNERVTLTVNESKLDNAPQQANMSDEEFQRNLQSHYGVAPAFEGESNQMETDPTRSMDQDHLETDPTKPMDPSQPGQPGMDPTPQTN